MKKLICLVLTLMLCVGAVAMAVPSKTTGDMAQTTTIKEANGEKASENLIIEPIANEKVAADQVEKVQTEINKLQEAAKNGDILTYYDNMESEDVTSVIVENGKGEIVTVAEVVQEVGIKNPTVNEMMPIVVQNFDIESGSKTVSHSFATKYTQGQSAVVVIKVVDKDGNIKNFVLTAVGAEDDSGDLVVEYPPEVLEAMQNSVELPILSVISDAAEGELIS